MDLKELKVKLRGDFTNYIIPLVKKDICRICGASDELVVHHEVSFSNQLFDVLTELSMLKDDFNNKEFNIVRNAMLGSQLRNKNATLCSKCHIQTHVDMGGFNAGNKATSAEQQLIQRSIFKNDLDMYLDNLSYKKLFKEEQRELIDKINYKKNGKLIKSYNLLNEYLIEASMSYMITPKVTRVNGRNTRCWVVIEKNIEKGDM